MPPHTPTHPHEYQDRGKHQSSASKLPYHSYAGSSKRSRQLVPCTRVTGPYANVNQGYTGIWVSQHPVPISPSPLMTAQQK